MYFTWKQTKCLMIIWLSSFFLGMIIYWYSEINLYTNYCPDPECKYLVKPISDDPKLYSLDLDYGNNKICLYSVCNMDMDYNETLTNIIKCPINSTKCVLNQNEIYKCKPICINKTYYIFQIISLILIALSSILMIILLVISN